MALGNCFAKAPKKDTFSHNVSYQYTRSVRSTKVITKNCANSITICYASFGNIIYQSTSIQFYGLLDVASVDQIMHCRQVYVSVNIEFVRKEEKVASFDVLLRYLPTGFRRSQEKPQP